ncbi:MAG: hypothetical protein LBJ17_08685 [Dysgonamonadaceae bacterium]|jgi:hypothetical protein|nr:hypothetical protein [Dysgonamonadaceae bacterium]
MKKLSVLIPVENVKQNVETTEKGYRNYSFRIDLKAGKITTKKGEEISEAKYQEIELEDTGEGIDLFKSGIKVTMNIDNLTECIQTYNGKNYLVFDIVQKSEENIEKNPDFGFFSAVYYDEEADSYEYLKGVFVHNFVSGFGRRVSVADFMAPKTSPEAAPLKKPAAAPAIEPKPNDDLPF